jgi:hypothetical protein
MNNDKVNEALSTCRLQVHEHIGGVGILSAERHQDAFGYLGQLEHALWMIDEAQSWPAERLEKKFRWLGFVQGVLWALHVVSVEDAKRMNMPKDEEFKP